MNDPYNWLTSYFDSKTGAPKLVADLIPPIFDQYFILFDNYGIIEDFPFDEYPRGYSTIDNLNKQHNIERTFGLFLNWNREPLYKPISIKDLAARFKIPYSIETVDKITHPGIAPLHRRSETVFADLINTLVNAPINLIITGYYGNIDLIDKPARSRITTPKEYYDYLDASCYDSDSYAFPDDRSWCMMTGEDLYPILACNMKTASLLSQVRDLEYFATTSEALLPLK